MKTGLIVIAMALVSGTVMAQEAKMGSETSARVTNSVSTGHQKTATKAAAKAAAKVEANTEKAETKATRVATKTEQKVNKDVENGVEEVKGKGSAVSTAATSATSAEVKAIERTDASNKGRQVKVVAANGTEVKTAVQAAQDRTVKVNSGVTTSTAAKARVKPVKAAPVKTAVKVNGKASVGLH